MSATSIKSKTSMSQNYEGEFKLSDLDTLKGRCLLTTPFFPLPNVHIKFCFEVHYVVSNVSCLEYKSGHDIILITLKLMTLSVSNVPTNMKLKLDVVLKFLDNTALHRYKLLPSLTTNEINSISFNDLIINFRKDGDISRKLKQENAFKIKCNMEFSNHINPPPHYYKELSSSVHLKNFASNFKSVQNVGEFSDITIMIGEKSFPAHKAVLAAHSPVFRNMLTHNFKESLTNIITITDFSPHIFEHFLKYMYSGEIEDESWPLIKELYSIADKYDISSLKQQLSDIIVCHISIENICDVLMLCFDYDDEKIKKEAVGFASLHIKELISTKDWKELIAKHPLAGYETAISYIL